MSSATPYDTENAWATATKSMDARMLDAGEQLGLTERQRRLNALWARYRCLQYDGRKVAWDGSQAFGPDESEQVATAGFLPPGYVDPGGASLPIRFRKPSAPYHLFRVIVDRFTSLLFNERRHPQIRIEDDLTTEVFARALWDTARGWAAMMRARAYGGAQGTVAVGFHFPKGRPVIEVHDPRWLFPDFADRFTLALRKVEKRLMYPQEVRRDDGRGYETQLFWYRRVWDAQSDTTFLPAKVEDDGREPDWQPDPDATFQHGLGFCPVVWAQNLPVDDDVDGAPDCEGVLDVLEALDVALSQTHKGVVANADPTLTIAADGEMGKEIQTGSDNAIKLPKDGTASYLEIAGSSIDAGLKITSELRRIALEVAQCVLEASGAQTGGEKATATEVDRTYSSMLAKGGMLREQYGQKVVAPLLQMMITASRKLGAAKTVNVAAPDGTQVPTIQRGGVWLSGWKGIKLPGGLVEPPPAPLGSEMIDIQLQWPEFFEPSLADVQAAAQAAVVAKTGGLIDTEHAVKFAAPFFHAEDADAMMANIEAESAQGDLAAGSLDALNSPKPPAPPGATPPSAAPPRPPGVPSLANRDTRALPRGVG